MTKRDIGITAHSVMPAGWARYGGGGDLKGLGKGGRGRGMCDAGGQVTPGAH